MNTANEDRKLVKELAEEFGYRNDAEEFRTRIERARAQSFFGMAVVVGVPRQPLTFAHAAMVSFTE